MKKEHYYLASIFWVVVTCGWLYFWVPQLAAAVALITLPLWCIWSEMASFKEIKNITAILKHWLGMR